MKNANIKRMTTVALLMALIVVMQFISASIPPISGFSISLVLIPLVMGAALYGAKIGALLGATFGIIVYINCVTGFDASGHMVFEANPILCFIVVLAKGILAGIASGAVYQALKKVNAYFAMLAAAVVCPVVNTGVFIICMLTVFPSVLSAWAGGGDVLAYTYSALIIANFVPELIINVVFSPAGQRILHQLKI